MSGLFSFINLFNTSILFNNPQAQFQKLTLRLRSSLGPLGSVEFAVRFFGPVSLLVLGWGLYNH